MFNFTEVRRTHGASLLTDSIRLSKSRVAFGDNVLPASTKGSTVHVQIDVANQAIGLKVGHGGYVVQEDTTGMRGLTLGPRLVKTGMLIGDYVPVPGEENVFVLATGKTQ